jgi:hypothetical protein
MATAWNGESNGTPHFMHLLPSEQAGNTVLTLKFGDVLLGVVERYNHPGTPAIVAVFEVQCNQTVRAGLSLA